MNVFTVDMLHCYDDFILQLDDEIMKLTQDPRGSIGFRSCRELQSSTGRVFFHCNDHAIARIPKYEGLLKANRDSGDSMEQVMSILADPKSLWNFKGLMAFRPWGPKLNWTPAAEFQFAPVDTRGFVSVKAAQWVPNNSEIGMFITSMQFQLPAGQYAIKTGTVGVPSEKTT